ncbi:MAG: AtpZ/AtpI family protein [Blastocatellia bacterium]|nr:AtpZ/AtpI family protein [Blastocatellia bacterium]
MRDDPKPDPKSENPANQELNASSFAGVGLQFAVSIVLFLFLGQWIDRKLGSSPVFLLAGVFIGGGAAFYSMYRRLATAQKADDERRNRSHEERSN